MKISEPYRVNYIPLLIEKQSFQITFWKFFHVFAYLLAFVGSIVACMTFGDVLNAFDGNCILFSSLAIEVKPNNTVKVILSSVSPTIWGPLWNCNFCLYESVTAACAAFIWCALFLTCGSGGSDRSSPQFWKIVFPAFIFAATATVLSLYTGSVFTDGTDKFCDNLEIFNTSCAEIEDYKWQNFPEAENFNEYLVCAEVGMWLSTVGWFLAMLSLLLRCIMYVDFKVAYTLPLPSQSECE